MSVIRRDNTSCGSMMLAYPSAFMQRPPFAAAAVGTAAYPHGMPNYSQLSLAAIPQYCSAATPPTAGTLAAFALHLNSPSQATAQEQKEVKSPPVQEKESTKKPTPSATNGSKSSFSIASILARDDDKPTKHTKTEVSVATTIPLAAHRDQQVSPVTPLSAGHNPGSFYYFYPPHPQPPSSFPFHTQPCLTDSELHRSRALHPRISAPVAVISEIVRNAGEY